MSSISLAEQPKLVVAKMRSSSATIRQPCFLRTVSRIHQFNAEGHSLVPAIGSASNWMPEDFLFVEFLLLHQRNTPTRIFIFSLSLLILRMLRCGICTSPTPQLLLTLDWRYLYLCCILLSHIRVQCRLFGRGIIIGTVLRAKQGFAYLNRFTTWRATPDDRCTSARSVTVYTRLTLCINTFRNGLNGAEQPKPLLCQGLSCTTTSFPRGWAQRLSTTLGGLQQQLLLLDTLVARVAAQPPASDSLERELATNCGSSAPMALLILLSLNYNGMVSLKTCAL